MSVIIFLIILAILVLVHEFGHFIVAKKSGIRVDEFGLGFPPRLFSWKRGETTYSLNLIPFGGYVKIFGENPDEESIRGKDSSRSFVNKPRHIQAAVMVAGIAFNIIFAWLLISLGYMSGLPTPVGVFKDAHLENVRLIVTGVSSKSPAADAGIKVGDAIVYAEAGPEGKKASLQGEALDADKVRDFISSHGTDQISFLLQRGQGTYTAQVMPKTGIVEGRFAIGITMDQIGTLRLPVHKALWQGAVQTKELSFATAEGLVRFIGQSVKGRADFSQISGPVGIEGLVDSARDLGFIYLLSFTAFISINLAILNLIPFPALDGGRLLFVAIEAVMRRPIKPKVANAVNGIGFAILLLLMLIVTFKDIAKIIGR